MTATSRESRPGSTARFRRAPYLVVEWEDEAMVLVNCNTLRRYRVDANLLALLSRLHVPRSVNELEGEGVQVSSSDLERLTSLGVLERSDDSDRRTTSTSIPWNPFELMVQRSSNGGGSRGEEYFRSAPSPPPVFKPVPNGPVIDLPPPLAVLPNVISDVLEQRRTLRRYGDRPLGLEELSTLLWHSARVTHVGREGLTGEIAFRPFPTGGARSELEIYVVAESVQGLAPGAHYFNPQSQQLVQVRQRDEHQERLLRWVTGATGGVLNRPPGAVLLITAVFARVMWKYRGISLSLIYKDTGCLLQTLYLVATALTLAPCAIGAGEELANSRWLGLDPLAESQVGCLLIGSRPSSAGQRAGA